MGFYQVTREMCLAMCWNIYVAVSEAGRGVVTLVSGNSDHSSHRSSMATLLNLRFTNTLHSVCRTSLFRLLPPQLRTMSIKVGDEIPSVDLFEETPANSVNTRDLCAGRKILIFAVPGAFTPGCSKTHLPGYISQADAIKNKGIEEIACVAVNDPFVMAAWGECKGAGDKVRMLADTNGEFTKAVGLDQDLAVLGGLRSKRYSMIVEDGKVAQLNVEPDGKGLSCSLAENTLAKL
nr:peroxiredoxin-5, mitochondrial-like [Cherax quadricarinatus]